MNCIFKGLRGCREKGRAMSAQQRSRKGERSGGGGKGCWLPGGPLQLQAPPGRVKAPRQQVKESGEPEINGKKEPSRTERRGRTVGIYKRAVAGGKEHEAEDSRRQQDGQSRQKLPGPEAPEINTKWAHFSVGYDAVQSCWVAIISCSDRKTTGRALVTLVPPGRLSGFPPLPSC